MAIPPPLRYWLIRLKTLNRPVLWCSGLAVVLLAVVINQYRNHPEWLGRFEVERDGPSQGAPGSTLSPEEQASVADIDNLSALYSDLGIDPLLPESTLTPQAAAEPSQDLLSVLQSAAPASAGSATAPDPSASPFSNYLEQYRFPGNSALAASASSSRPGTSSLLAALPSTESTAAGLNGLVSPLQQAIQQLGGQQLGGQALLGQPSSGGDLTGSLTERGAAPAQSPLQSQPLAGEGSLVPGISPATLPGSNQTFLRTTPQMSPAPGTTGYVPPATLTLPGSPYSNAPVPQAAPITPNLSPIGPGQPLNNGLPVPTTGGTVLPPATGSVYDAPDALASPAPFSAPRPPGSYAGNGYIYTFSDPNGPVR